MKDRNDIIPLLHTLHHPTFFSCDHGFYRAQLRYAGYCVVWLDVLDDEAAVYIRRLLRHQAFRTQAQRMGKVIRVRHSGVSYWQLRERKERIVSWWPDFFSASAFRLLPFALCLLIFLGKGR